MRKRIVTKTKAFLLFLCFVFCGCGESNPEGGLATCENKEALPPASTSVPLSGNPFEVEVLTEYMGLQVECVVIEDLDRDGHLDIALARSGYIPFGSNQESAYVNEMIFLWGEGNRIFTPEILDFPEGASPTTGCTALDLNNDGTLDVLVGTGEGNLAAAIQGEPRAFDVVTDLVTLPEDANHQRMVTVVPVDLDGEGASDLIVGTFAVIDPFCVGLQEDPGGGKDVTLVRPMVVPAQIHCLVAKGPLEYVVAPAGICPENITSMANGPVWTGARADLNHDGLPDILLTVDYGANVVLLSGPGRTWKDVSVASGLANYNHAMGFGVADYDGDGIEDVYISDTGPDQLWRGTGCGGFEDVSQSSGVAVETDRGDGWGVTAVDFDHDGDVDIFVTNSFVTGEGGWAESNLCPQNLPVKGEQSHFLPGAPEQVHFLLENDGTGHFERHNIPLMKPMEMLRTPVTKASGDLDRDGDIDVVVIENRMLHLYWNEGEKTGDWIVVRPIEPSGLPSVGARVRILDGEGRSRWQDVYGTHGRDGHSALEAHFGLGGQAESVDVQVVWPDGSISQISNQKVNRLLTVTRVE